jgi:type IV secretory pathway VirB10-like protein
MTEPASPFRERIPVVTRLNRNALWVVAALGVVTVFVAVAFLAPSRTVVTRENSAPVRPQRPGLPPERLRVARESVVVAAPAVIVSRGGVERRGRVSWVQDSGRGDTTRELSAYVLVSGTVIPVALVTDIDSDLPGTIVGQVSRDVYDSRTESVVVIPRGARMIGRYDDRVVTGQSRVMVVWTRLVFPDGSGIAMVETPGVDAMGAAGVAGAVDSHLTTVFERAGLLSALGVGAQLSQPTGSGTSYAAPSTGQVAAGAVGQQLSQVGLEMVRQGLSIKPTITVKGGTVVQVMLTRDLELGRAW